MSEELIRLASALIAGTLISFMGSFVQLRSQNILASTSTLGLDSLSILWILLFHSVTVIFHIEVSFWWQLIVGIMVFGGFGFYLAGLSKKKFSIEKLLLFGLSLNLFVGAVYSLWQFLFLAFNFDFPTELLFGHFRFAGLRELIPLLVFLLVFLGGLKVFWKNLEVYSTGEQITRLAGVDYQRMSQFFLTIISISVFLLVFLFGGFAFLGLVLPIVSRGLWFHRWGLKGEFLWGALVNGLFFMLTDLVCYLVPLQGAELPVGLISGVMGSLGLIILLRGKTKTW